MDMSAFFPLFFQWIISMDMPAIFNFLFQWIISMDMPACALQTADDARRLGEQHDDDPFCLGQLVQLDAVYQGNKLILHVPSSS